MKNTQTPSTSFRLDEEMKNKLSAIADAYGNINATSAVKILIKAEYDRLIREGRIKEDTHGN